MRQIIYTLLLSLTLLSANDIYKSTTKTSCIQQSSYGGKSLAQQKKILIEQAKQEALEELYGTLMFSSTDIKDGKITGDEVRSRAVGAVRVKGNPKFYNGKNFGEICSDVSTYITKKDLEKYSPQEVVLTHFCYSDSNTPVRKIKPLAKKKAYIEAISQYKPSLSNISMAQAKSLIHGFKISNDNFDFDTGAYCFDAVATLLPYELEIGNIKKLKSNNVDEFDASRLKPGLIATFYSKNDFNMKKPIYTQRVKNLNLAYKSYPETSKLNPKIPYLVKIKGYIAVGEDINTKLTMYHKVYSAKLTINDKKVLTHKKKYKTIKLNRGYNKVILVIKSAKKYDIRIVGDGLETFYYQ